MSTIKLLPRRRRYVHKLNAKTWAKQFRARILEPGIVSYQDQDCGNALLKKETIDRHIHTFIGRPLILARDGMNRPTFKHAKVRPSNLEKMADGYISGVEYNGADGWWYAVGTVHNDEAKKAIEEIGYVSCAYDVTGLGGPGDYHNLEYHEEITAFEGEHLAIVDNPRYEEATIRLLNSKNKPKHTMFNWIKKALGGEQKTNSVETGVIPEGAVLEIDGKEVPAADVVAGYQKHNSTSLDGESEIEVDGKPVSVNALIASHQKLNAMDEEEKNKKNAADEEEEKKKKENAAKEAEEAERKAKENSAPKKTYKVNSTPGPISKAREAGVLVEVTNSAPDTQDAKLKRGMDRYGPRTK